ENRRTELLHAHRSISAARLHRETQVPGPVLTKGGYGAQKWTGGKPSRTWCLLLILAAGRRGGSMIHTAEIAPEIYRISIFVPEINLEFSHFLVRDEEPLLFHAGLRGMFPVLRQEISRLMDPSKIRHIGFSHFESDECGGLNEWLQIASAAEPVCGLVGAMVSVNDFANRPARVLTRDDVLSTGRYRFRFIPTPHVPHGWDAGVLFEESERTLFCSDLFHQWGLNKPATTDSVMGRCQEALIQTEAGPFANYVPYTHHTGRV